MIRKIIIGLCVLAFSNIAAAVERNIYRDCESGSWFVTDLRLHIKYDVELETSLGRPVVMNHKGTFDGETLRKSTSDAWENPISKMVYEFNYISAAKVSNSASGYPEGTKKLRIMLREEPHEFVDYKSSEWVWNKTAGWHFDEVGKGDCFRVKGKP